MKKIEFTVGNHSPIENDQILAYAKTAKVQEIAMVEALYESETAHIIHEESQIVHLEPATWEEPVSVSEEALISLNPEEWFIGRCRPSETIKFDCNNAIFNSVIPTIKWITFNLINGTDDIILEIDVKGIKNNQKWENRILMSPGTVWIFLERYPTFFSTMEYPDNTVYYGTKIFSLPTEESTELGYIADKEKIEILGETVYDSKGNPWVYIANAGWSYKAAISQFNPFVSKAKNVRISRELEKTVISVESWNLEDYEKQAITAIILEVVASEASKFNK